MPTYEYRCPAGHLFEKFEPMSKAKQRVKCPECGRMAERQISGGAGLVFKGSGFYITDYKRAEKGGRGRTEPDKADKSEKAEQSEKPEKTEKAEKGEKGEKGEKAGKPDPAADSGKKGPA